MGGYDSVVIIDDLFQVANGQGCAPNLVNLQSFLFFSLILRLQALLILDEFLFHKQVIFDSLLSQQTEAALG